MPAESIQQLVSAVQALEQVGGYGEFLLTSLFVLLVVCTLAWAVLRFGVRRLVAGGRMGKEGPIRVLARLPLEPRQTLYIVEAGGKTLLVGAGDRPVQVLAELDRLAVTEAMAESAKGRSFADVLARVTRKSQDKGGPLEERST